MTVVGLAMDWIEAIADAVDEPDARPAGGAEPQYAVSPQVTVSRDHGLYVYHLADDQLGQGSSLGNARAWAETKGMGDMLSLFSIETGTRVLGGLSVTYLLPFSDLSACGVRAEARPAAVEAAEEVSIAVDAAGDVYAAAATAGGVSAPLDRYARVMPTARGVVYLHPAYLHPAYQQREFILGDGLHVLETFFLPRTGMDDPAAAYTVVALKSRTPHPLRIIIGASLDLRGATPHDVVACYDEGRGALVAHNRSHPDWVRVFGATAHPRGYGAATDEERAYSPGGPLANCTDDCGDLTGALQFDLLLLPGQRHTLRLVCAFSPHGQAAALSAYDQARHNAHALKHTIAHYADVLGTALAEVPDVLLTQGIQWAKACLLRPVSRYALGDGITNDPGRSTRFVGRDTAWYTHGCDFVLPELSCAMLRTLAGHQRADGLIREYIDGCTGETEDHGFNINDNTPLFVMAVAHHIQATGHHGCLCALYDAARRAGAAILAARDERGLVRCLAGGEGIGAICGWRNIMQTAQISGAVTEVNAESYAALRALADLATRTGHAEDAGHFAHEAAVLRAAINTHLIDRRTGLYVRNIDSVGQAYTQATVDLVFPLICGVADEQTAHAITGRLAMSDFMTPGGIRALPAENPRYDPSFEYGLLGGVWPGATWWYAMDAARTNPQLMAALLRRSYWHYVADPRVYNTVPGQFSEWSDGQTLVNRGMRLSPWEAPRYLWATIEGAVGLQIVGERIALEPHLPDEWSWLRVHDLPCRGRRLSFFLTRQGGALHAYACDAFGGELVQHQYDEELVDGVEAIATGVSITAFRRGDEVLVCLGNSLDTPGLGPFLAHHALDAHMQYRASRLTHLDTHWHEVGTIGGGDLQRVTIRLEPHGYGLYRFEVVR